MRELLEVGRSWRSAIQKIPPVNRHQLQGHGDLIGVGLDRRGKLAESIEQLPQAVRGLSILCLRKQELLDYAARAGVAPA